MKFTIESSHLSNAMKRVTGVVENRNTIPILANILIVAETDSITLRGTDLDVEVTVKVPAQVDETGSVTVVADTLRDFIAKLPKGAQAKLETDGDELHLKITSGRTRATLRTLPVEDFPDLNVDSAVAASFSLTGKDISSLIGHTRFAMSTEETRYYLNGVYLNAGNGRLIAVATDGHRLAKAEIDAPDGSADIPSPGIIIPFKTVGLLMALYAGMDEVSVSVTDRKIKLDGGDTILTSKLIDGTFPDYERVIPTGNNQIAIVNRLNMAGAIGRIATVASEKGRAAKLSFDAGKMVLTANDTNTGSAEDEIDISFDAPALEIGFNSRYLSDVLSNLDDESIRIELNDGGSPTVFRGEGSTGQLVVLMPMRV